MGRLFKVLVALVVVGLLALIVFAYLGDLTPESETVSDPVELDVD